MTGVSWVRLDVTFPDNHKVLELTYRNRHRAVAVYLCGLAYAGAQGNEGWIPVTALTRLHGRKADAAHLVEVGLWIEEEGGWQIHDWSHYQPTNEEIEEKTQRRRDAARRAANIRWGNKPLHDAARNA